MVKTKCFGSNAQKGGHVQTGCDCYASFNKPRFSIYLLSDLGLKYVYFMVKVIFTAVVHKS